MSITVRVLAPLFALSCVIAPVAHAQLRLPALFSDGMVWQQQTHAPMWGWASAGEAVSVHASWSAEPVETRAGPGGRWRVDLVTPGAGGPHTVTVRASSSIVLTDVLVGEVWICSGQSNMEWPLTATEGDPGLEAALADAERPALRLFEVAHHYSADVADDVDGAWSRCSSSAAMQFSAIGFHFGREIQDALDGVPVGLIGCHWGGTLAEAWTSEETLRPLGGFADALDVVAETRRDPDALIDKQRLAESTWWARVLTADPGSSEGWLSRDHDDAAWNTIHMPSLWEDHGVAFDGVMWLRCHFDLPAAMRGRDLLLELGPVDDMDTTWINARWIGGLETSGHWRTPRVYTVPSALLLAEDNVLVVRAVDTGGAGGMSGTSIVLKTADDGRLEERLDLDGNWRYREGVDRAEMPAWPQTSSIHQNTPTALSNGMLEPVIPFAIRGAIWYQGESNRLRARDYRSLFPAMITDWRRRWGRGDFPFYYVQIAPFGYGDDTGQAAALREAQLMAMDTVPNVGMVCTMDIGNSRDIHPRNKTAVGHRLARWALSRTYGKSDIVSAGPLPFGHSVEGNAMRLSFLFADGLTTHDGNPPSHFTLAGADGVFHPASARVEGFTVVVSSPEVSRPVAARYAWGAADQPNLVNAAGLPATSFRTDDG